MLRSGSRPLSISYFLIAEADSLGNMLREMQEEKKLKDDFIIMYSDIVCNASLEGAMRLHYESKKPKKN
jgi:translation initiation factor eIF-2B subunit epsilon